MRKIIIITAVLFILAFSKTPITLNAQAQPEETACSSISLDPPTGTPETPFVINLSCTGEPNTVLIINQDTSEEVWRMTLLPGWADNPIPVTRSLAPGNYEIQVWAVGGRVIFVSDPFQVSEGEVELPQCGDIISLEDENLCPLVCPAFTRYDPEQGSITRCETCGNDLQACCPTGEPCSPGLTCRILPPATSGTCLLLDFQEEDPHFCFTTNNLNTAIGCIPFDLPESIAIFFLGWGTGVGGGIAFLLSVYAGFQILTSSGDPKRLEGGKSLLWSALTGLSLIIFSVFLLRFIGINILGISN